MDVCAERECYRYIYIYMLYIYIYMVLLVVLMLVVVVEIAELITESVGEQHVSPNVFENELAMSEIKDAIITSVTKLIILLPRSPLLPPLLRC